MFQIDKSQAVPPLSFSRKCLEVTTRKHCPLTFFAVQVCSKWANRKQCPLTCFAVEAFSKLTNRKQCLPDSFNDMSRNHISQAVSLTLSVGTRKCLEIKNRKHCPFTFFAVKEGSKLTDRKQCHPLFFEKMSRTHNAQAVYPYFLL